MKVSHCGSDIDVTHCDTHLDVFEPREIDPNKEEALRGVTSVKTRTYWCQKEDCKKRLYFKREQFEVGQGPYWVRVKKNISSFVARLRRAGESDWVWGYNSETYGKIKVTVR